MPWDWALVEYHVPLVGAEGMHVFMKAIRTIPRSIEAGITNDGFVFDSSTEALSTDGLDPWVLKYPSSEVIDMETVIVGNVQISSLAIDLRRFFGAPVTVELWGYSIGSEFVPDQYHGPPMTLQSTVDHALGTADYSEVTDSWSPDLVSVLSGWPYYGNAVMPTLDGTTEDTTVSFVFDAITVDVEDAPIPHVDLVLEHEDPIETSFSQTLDWGHRITYDPASGIANSAASSVLGSTTEIISGPNNPRISRWTFSYQDQFYTREIETLYTLAAVDTELPGEIRFAGGFGVEAWKNMKVTNDATEYDRLYLDDGRFMTTVPIAEDVIVRGGTGISYQLLGRFTVFPFQYTAGFTKA